MQKTELVYLENCQFQSDLLLELFKTVNFFKKSFSFFFFQFLENRSKKFLYFKNFWLRGGPLKWCKEELFQLQSDCDME